MATRVYQYGVPGRIKTDEPGSRPGRRTVPVPVPPAIMTQVRLAHDLWNDMVAAWRQWQQGKVDLWSSHPEVAQVEDALETALTEAAEAAEAVSQANQQAKSRSRARSDVDRRLKEARQRVKELKAERKAAIEKAHREDPSIVPALKQLFDTYEEQIEKGLYWAYVHLQNPDRKGLYWGTYVALIKKHKTAASQIGKNRASGKPGEMRFHRFTGTGTIMLQLQRQHGSECRCVTCAGKLTKKLQKENADACNSCREGRCKQHVVEFDPTCLPQDPVRSPELLANGGGKWGPVFQLAPWQPDEPQRPVHGLVRFAIGPGGEQVELPVVLHRMIPPEADICTAELTIREKPGFSPDQSRRMSLAVTVRLPDPPPATGANVAVHIGWRTQPNGSVRVATWASDQPVAVPQQLSKVTVRVMNRRRQRASGADPYRHEAVVVATSPTTGEVFIPASWIDIAGRPPAIRAQRDLNMNELKEQVAVWLDENPQPEPVGEEPPHPTGAYVRTWRSPGRFVWLARHWGKNPPVGDGSNDIISILGDWKARDFHLWGFEANERLGHQKRRDDFFKQIAAWLTTDAGRVYLDSTNLAQLAHRPTQEAEHAIHPIAEDRARAIATLVAPGELRAAITKAATRRGVAVSEAAPPTRTCPKCRQVGQVGDPRYAAAAIVECPSCGHSYDQDHAVTSAYLASGPVTTATA